MSFNVDGLNYCEYAHEVVRETECSYCGARPGSRCVSRKREGQLDIFGKALAPSHSHRPRLELHARRKRLS